MALPEIPFALWSHYMIAFIYQCVVRIERKRLLAKRIKASAKIRNNLAKITNTLETSAKITNN